MTIVEAKHYIGCKVMSHDPGFKMIPRVDKAHGPYTLVKITKDGMAQLNGYGQSVAPRYLEKCSKPDREGIWEWFDELGRMRLVDVVNVAPDVTSQKHLRVAFWGGYYDINDDVHDIVDEKGNVVIKDNKTFAEWPDRWGRYVGTRDEVNGDNIYFIPNEEILEKIRNQSK
jgi:hypothetical protein